MYREHRERFLTQLRERKAAALIVTNTPKVRNHDSEYRFRPDSDFWYLTGFREPCSALVLLPGLEPGDEPRSVLFLQERDREKEIWNGVRLGVEAAPSALRVEEARPIDVMWQKLPELFAGYETIVYRVGIEEPRDREFFDVIEKLRRRARAGTQAPLEVLDPAAILHELRLFKSDDEIALMRRAAGITKEAHLGAMQAVQPGVYENEIDALLEYTFRRRGAWGPAYTNIVAGGANACILHYVENDSELKDGDLVLIDAGSEVEGYASDVTRTFPVNGRFTPEQRAIYELVLKAQEAAIESVRPGSTFAAGHECAVRILTEGLIELGLLNGDLEGAISDESYRRFYMHKTGHWIGLDVHDCGAYSKDGSPRRLEPGMALTVEPGLYIAADDQSVEARWRGIGVRIEDDVLVTRDGHEVLTAAIPKQLEEVEAACSGAHLESVA